MSSPHKNDILRYTRLGYKPSQIREKINYQLTRQRIKQIQDDLMDSDESLRNQYANAVLEAFENTKKENVARLKELSKQGCTISDAAKIVKKSIVYVRDLAKSEDIVFNKSKVPDLYKPGEVVWDWKIIAPHHEKETYTSGKVAVVKKYKARCLLCGDESIVLQKNLKLGKSRKCHRCSVTLR